jgi:hypothetical protein
LSKAADRRTGGNADREDRHQDRHPDGYEQRVANLAVFFVEHGRS